MQQHGRIKRPERQLAKDQCTAPLMLLVRTDRSFDSKGTPGKFIDRVELADTTV